MAPQDSLRGDVLCVRNPCIFLDCNTHTLQTFILIPQHPSVT
jgi:hypothetical protein